jgi:hypothetical protein
VTLPSPWLDIAVVADPKAERSQVNEIRIGGPSTGSRMKVLPTPETPPPSVLSA